MRFWKYQGLGNDFILFENLDGKAPHEAKTVKQLCDRRFGIGADGILYINKADHDSGADCFMKILNSDGSEAEMCGNGIRCVAKHLYDMGTVKRDHFKISTLAGMKEIMITASEGKVEEVTVEMGAPDLVCRDIPMSVDGNSFIDGQLEVNGKVFRGTAVSMGNPHIVIFDDITQDEMLKFAPLIQASPFFPKKTNVEFARKCKDGINVNVLERGAGWTLACGTGACATAVAATLKGIAPFGEDIRIKLPGGVLTVNVNKDLSSVRMTGPAVRVFHGEIEW